MVYPKENRILANRILSNGGTLMSEYPVGKRRINLDLLIEIDLS